MGHTKLPRNRRRDQQVDLDGRAVLFQRGDRLGQYTLRDISAGGAIVSGEREDVRPGHLVHVLVDLERGNGPMSLTGAIRRARGSTNGDAETSGLAISFPTLSADQEDAIHDAVLRALVRRETSASQRPLLVFEPRRRVREEIESEVRSFGRTVVGVQSLTELVNELESEETEYAALVIHSATHDPRAMDVIEFFTRSEHLRTIILPEPGGALTDRAEALARLPQVKAPRMWSREELRRALHD
jgi:hypothetical protein